MFYTQESTTESITGSPTRKQYHPLSVPKPTILVAVPSKGLISRGNKVSIPTQLQQQFFIWRELGQKLKPTCVMVDLHSDIGTFPAAKFIRSAAKRAERATLLYPRVHWEQFEQGSGGVGRGGTGSMGLACIHRPMLQGPSSFYDC